jgi:hypothetical protein
MRHVFAVASVALIAACTTAQVAIVLAARVKLADKLAVKLAILSPHKRP